MTRSLERHLSRTLGLVIVLTGLLAGAASFGFAYLDAQEFQDDTLRQIAVLAGADQLHQQSGSNPNVVGIDPEVRVMIMQLPLEGTTGSWISAGLQPGFHTVHHQDGNWRVFVRQTKRGTRVAALQSTEARNEMAINSALRTLAPILVLLPLLVWLAVRTVRAELASVRRLAQTIDAQPAGSPVALPEDDLPIEIAPFVRAINRLLERVGRLMGEQRRFIADAAHELRTPLTALSLQAQNLEQAESLEAMLNRVAPLRAGIERAQRLTGQLLSLARSQSAPLNLDAVDISKMARELIAECLPLAESRGIDLGLEDAGGSVLLAEPETLRLVLKNALDNALRYSYPGGEVTLCLYTEGDDAVVEIIDSGPGIPVAERERVFDPFYRMEGTAGTGSGLGLAIARDAAARLSGSVGLHDRASGPGLVFRYRQQRFSNPDSPQFIS